MDNFKMKQVLFILLLCPTLFGCGQKKINFEKIIFHSSPSISMYSPPIYSLEIDSNRKMNLRVKGVYKFDREGLPVSIDSSKVGYFTGIINDSLFDSLYNKLNHFIQTVAIDSLTGDCSRCATYAGQFYTIIVYYNGIKKVLMSSGIPDNSNADLINILCEICDSSHLQRTTEFSIEGDSDF